MTENENCPTEEINLLLKNSLEMIQYEKYNHISRIKNYLSFSCKRSKRTKTRKGNYPRKITKSDNRRTKRTEKQLKEARQMVALIGNEIFRLDNTHKSTGTVLKIVAKVTQNAHTSLNNKAGLVTEKETWLHESRYRKFESIE